MSVVRDPVIVQDVWNAHEKRCAWCRSRVSCGIDHIYPKSAGGPNRRWNYQLLCGKCGQWKNNSLPGQVVARIQRLKVTKRNRQWAEKVKSRGMSQMSKFINSEEAKAFMENHPIPKKLRDVH